MPAGPRVCFLPTAGGREPGADRPLLRGVLARDCEPSHLTLFGMPEDPAEHLAQQDVIYVGGGNTANMLAIWRVHGIDRALREAWGRGAVLGGMSAGANCWFEDVRHRLVRPRAARARRRSRDPLRELLPALRRRAGAAADVHATRRRRRPAAGLRGRRRRGVPLRGDASCARSSASATVRAATA